MSQKGHPTSSPAGSEKLLPHPTASSLGRPHPTRAQALLTSQGPCGTGACPRHPENETPPLPAPPCPSRLCGVGGLPWVQEGGPHLGAGLWGRCEPRGGGPGGGQAAQAALGVGAQGPVLSGTPRPWRSFRQMPEHAMPAPPPDGVSGPALLAVCAFSAFHCATPRGRKATLPPRPGHQGATDVPGRAASLAPRAHS